MMPQEDSPLRISKWPFYLGDVLLVATALAIGILGEWNLSVGEILACVLSVALGAGLFVLPYLYEYTMSHKESAEDVEAKFRVLSRQIQRVEFRIADIELQPEAPKGEGIDLKKALEPLEKRLELLEAAEKQPGEVAERFSSLLEKISEMDKRVKAIDNARDKVISEAESTAHEPRKRRSGQNNLLQRAIKEKQEPDLPAVSRIIEAVPGHGVPEKPPLNDDSPIGEAITSPEPESAEPGISKKVEPVSAPVVEPVKKPEAEEIPEPERVDSETDAVKEAVSSDDLFSEEEAPAKPKIGKRKGKNDSVLTVNALIGIGNKPYLRGSGGGLSWEAGVQMNFQSIGKWEWTAPDILEEPIELQVFCNDNEPDQNGKQTLQPGEKLEISPKFKS